MFNPGRFKTRGVLLAACLFAASPAQALQSHEHGHAQQQAMQLKLNDGTLWATDAPLRDGMEQIRAAADIARRAELQGHFDSAEAAALATEVEAGILHMVRNCRLPPDADANLHILLGQLSSASQANKVDPASADGLPKLLEALDRYPRYFSHPGWPATAPTGSGDATHSEHAH